VAKKRRVTADQARLLAIQYILDAVQTQRENEQDGLVADVREEAIEQYWKKNLPANWFDGQTSMKSWGQLWNEVDFQLHVILKGLDREAVRVSVEDPAMKYKIQYPLSNGHIGT
jgi:hypothetical protein